MRLSIEYPEYWAVLQSIPITQLLDLLFLDHTLSMLEWRNQSVIFVVIWNSNWTKCRLWCFLMGRRWSLELQAMKEFGWFLWLLNVLSYLWASAYTPLNWKYTRQSVLHTCGGYPKHRCLEWLAPHSLQQASHWFWPVLFFWTPDNTRLHKHTHDEYTNVHMTHSTCMIYLQIGCVHKSYVHDCSTQQKPGVKAKRRAGCIAQRFRIPEAEKSN